MAKKKIKKAKRSKRRTSNASITSPVTDRAYRVREAADCIERASQLRQDKPLMRSVNVELGKREKAIKNARKSI